MMRVISSLLDKLRGRQAPPCLLVGLRMEKGDVIIVDILNLMSENDNTTLHPGTDGIMPQGLVCLGAWAADHDTARTVLQDPSVLSLLRSHKQSASGEDISVVIMSPCTTSDSAIESVYMIPLCQVKSEHKAAPMEISIIHSSAPTAWLAEAGIQIIRIQTELSLTVASDENGKTLTSKDITDAYQKLEEELRDPRSVFVLGGSMDRKRALAGTLSSPQPVDLSGLAASSHIPIEARLMIMPSDSLSSSAPASAPLFRYIPSAGTINPQAWTCLLLKLDCLVYCLSSGRAVDGGELGASGLTPALIGQLGEFRASMITHGGKPVSAYHFLPPGRAHHVTVTYPQLKKDVESNELALASYRRELHALLGLPLDRPSLRTTIALTWQQAAKSSGQQDPQERLKDVHEGLSSPGSGDAGSVHLIQGSYDYHHYMQDKFDDNGWGCAYRSLQTICSWFRLQQYTAKASPSHREIQQILVKLGDKEKSFVGSSKWIGAIELSYILDDYLGVSCKIITINRGSDIPSHARELAAHFRTQGTPIMIGGGVLAYTLLGVYFNESTGDCAFLILDPHYTGGENLGRIHKGTWVSWKRPGDSAAAGGPLFVNDAFYNFLCPQRPKEV